MASKWLFAKHRIPVGAEPVGVIVDDRSDLVIAEVYDLEGVNNGPLMAMAPELRTALKSATDHIHDLRIILEQAAEMGLTLHMCGVTYNHESALALIAKAEATNVH